MSVEAAQWRFLGRTILSSQTWANVMDAIFTLGQSTTYPDGTARTIGSGSAGTWSRYQNAGTTEAVYCTPAISPLNHRIVFAAAAVSPSPAPTYASGTFRANIPAINLIKNAGAFSSWNAASPFTSGQTMGYVTLYGGNTGTTSITGSINVWESRDSVALLLLSSNVTSFYAFAGALIDPESTDVVNDAESDGKVYGIITGNSDVSTGGYWPTNWMRINANNTSIGLSQLGSNFAQVFTPNGSTLIPIYRANGLYDGWTNQGGAVMYTRSGRLVRMPIFYWSSTNVIGRLREVTLFTNSQVPRRFLSGGTPLGYVFGPSDTTDVNCVLLEH